jgi:hypothetical protein
VTGSYMSFVPIQGRHSIEFNVDKSGPDLDNQLGFIVLLSLRFSGEIKSVGPTSLHGDGKRLTLIGLKFTDYDSWDQARSHCYAHLDPTGMVRPSYRGALERADPGRGMTEKLKKQVEAARSN